MGIVDPGRALGGQLAESISVYQHDYTERTWAASHKGVITTREEFNAYDWPNLEDIDPEVLDDLSTLFPDAMKVIGIIGKQFTAWSPNVFMTWRQAAVLQ